MNIFQKLLLKYRLEKYHEVVDGEKKYIAGITPDKFDGRDLNTVGIFGLFEDYIPKNEDLKLQNLGIKDQQNKNTCGWVSCTSNRENTEGVKLAEQGLVQFGRREGLLNGDGLSNLRDNCKVAQKFGIPEAQFLPNDSSINWEEYSKFSMSQDAIVNAFSHRCESYSQITDKNHLLKFLDDGNYIHTGSQWFNEFNMRGGFSYPWIIGPGVGKNLVGGHAFEIVGYVKNYLGRGLHLRLQNSFGPNWGDSGYFYMPIDFAVNFLYSQWLIMDIHIDVARFLTDYASKDVRGLGQKAVYHIDNGQKFAYPDWLTYLSYGGLKEDILTVDSTLLDSVERGPDMDITHSQYWDVIKQMSAPDNYKKLLELTSANGMRLDTVSLQGMFNEIYLIKPNV